MTDGDLGNPHISFSEMWGLPKGRITGKPEVILKFALMGQRLRRGYGRRFAPSFATVAALPARWPTNCPASSLSLLSRQFAHEQNQFARHVRMSESS